MSATCPNRVRGMARGFNIRRQPGFTTIAMICFFLLYLPIVTLVVFAFLVGVLVGVLLVNSLNQPVASQVIQPQAAPAANQQTVYQTPTALKATAPPKADDYALGMATGVSTALYKVEQAIDRLTERVAKLDQALQRLAQAEVQLAQAEAQARTILAQVDFQIKQQQAALDAAARDQARHDAERATLTITLSVIAIEVVTMLMVGVLALILVVVRLRLQRPPAPPTAPQLAPRTDHDRAYWLNMRLTARENERTARRQRLREKTVSARSGRPYHDLPLAVMDDEE